MPVECRLPDLGENITSATIVEVLVAPGDTLAVDQAIAILETDKAEFELPSSVAGIIVEVLVQADDEVQVGQVVLTIEGDGAPPPAPDAAAATADASAPPPAPPPPAPPSDPVVVPPTAPGASAPSAADAAPVPASPSVRRLARELGVDIHRVSASGPRGRITAEDVQRYVKGVLTAGSTAGPGAGLAPAPLPDFSKYGPTTREPLSKVRRRTAENLSRAWATIPHVTQHDRADLTELERLRKQHAPQVEAAGGKLTVTAILLKVLAAALKKFPRFNASLDMATNELVLKQYVHLGVAVDTERGLLVPVIRDADTKNIVEIALELTDLASRARGRKIRPEMLEGASCTLTNLGGIGGTAFTPIINPPEVCILGASRATTMPVYRDGGFVPRLMAPFSLSYDHRVIDGADAARFLRWFCDALEQPFLPLLEG